MNDLNDIETLNGALAAWDTRMMTWPEYVEYFENKAVMDAEREPDFERLYELEMDYRSWLATAGEPEWAF